MERMGHNCSSVQSITAAISIQQNSIFTFTSINQSNQISVGPTRHKRIKGSRLVRMFSVCSV